MMAYTNEPMRLFWSLVTDDVAGQIGLSHSGELT